MSNDVVVHNPGTLMTQATDVAGVCGEIVKRTAKQIQGRKYVQVEGWQSIAAAYGCVASSKNVEAVKGGVRAIGELHRVADGALIATAEGFVGEDEATWYGGEAEVWDKDARRKVKKLLPKRNDFAIRAMAQTRAISRVCRSAFAFVVVLIDSNLATTPAEEMTGVFGDEPDERPARKGKTIEHENPAPQSSDAARHGPSAPPANSTAGGSPTESAGPPAETRDAVLTKLCKLAGANKIQKLAKAGVRHADELSTVDYMELVGWLQNRIEALADTVQP